MILHPIPSKRIALCIFVRFENLWQSIRGYEIHLIKCLTWFKSVFFRKRCKMCCCNTSVFFAQLNLRIFASEAMPVPQTFPSLVRPLIMLRKWHYARILLLDLARLPVCALQFWNCLTDAICGTLNRLWRRQVMIAFFSNYSGYVKDYAVFWRMFSKQSWSTIFT